MPNQKTTIKQIDVLTLPFIYNGGDPEKKLQQWIKQIKAAGKRGDTFFV